MFTGTSDDEPSSGGGIFESLDRLPNLGLLPESSNNKKSNNSAGHQGKYVQMGEKTMVDATDSAWVSVGSGGGGEVRDRAVGHGW